MPRTCKKCRRVNPGEAAFCYLDGTPLDGAGDSSISHVGALPFTAPFVLPSGRSCRNFNQLALACREDSAGALTVLKKGHLESFLGAQGRTDLADAAGAAARDLAHAADGERALDEFLGRLPAPALVPARLQVEPTTIDLGTLQPGDDRRCELILHNKGVRLLYGSASCDGVPWLALGEGPGRPRVLFQFHDRTVIPVHVVGRGLRAYRDPQQAEIRVESCGGTATVVVRVRVPVRPFSEGALKGALSPRELASKAKDATKEAAGLIESGAVARWYQSNGWTYPVAGPTASGLAAVQQLFEALGLVRPPRVELGEESVLLRGNPGQAIEYVLTLFTQEQRAVVAHGTSDQPWLRFGPTTFRGRSAFLMLNVVVPDRPGEILQASATITANGNQRFTVPVRLTVGTTAAAAVPAPATRPAALPVAKPAAAPVALPPGPPRVPAAVKAPPGGVGWTSLVPAALLGLVLLGVVVRDFFAPAAGSPSKPPAELDPVPRVAIRFHDARGDDELERLWLTDPAPTMRFGLVTLYKGHEVGTGANVNRLTFDPQGRTNNTCLRFDGDDERLFGSARGSWQERAARSWKDDRNQEHDGVRSVWACDDLKIDVTQFVELVRGEASRRLDTARVRYRIENRGTAARTVGIRFLLDTFIGGNDGVPFTIPGDTELCDTMKDIREARDRPVPDFLQALEKPSLSRPGTVAHLRLRLEDVPEAPERVTLGAWPSDRLRVIDRKALGPATLWEVPLLSMRSLELNDSAIVMYWKERRLAQGASREVGFEYGLWELASQGSRLATTVDGVFRPGKTLTVVAYVAQAGLGEEEETATLTLPEGFKLLEGAATQPVPRAAAGARSGNRPVTWRVEAGPTGKYEFTVKTSAGDSQRVAVEIRQEIFQ
jgi:hypothetical protein